MGTTITRPLSYTVVSADQVSTAPALNAGDDRPGMVWRTTGTAGYVILDMGTSATYDCVAVLGSTLTASDSVRVRTGTSSAGTGSFDSGTFAAFTGTKPLGFTSKSLYYFSTPRAERYVRIDFASAAVVEVQRVIVGTSITALGIDVDAEFTVFDTSDIDSSLGSDSIQQGLKKPKWKVTMSSVKESDFRAYWIGFLATVGKTVPILFNPFTDQPLTWQAEVVFGKVRNDAGGKLPGGNTRVVELTIEGLAL